MSKSKRWKKPRKRDLDKNMVELVEVLNSFNGVHTIGSCGGHENPTPAQWPAGSFYLKFDVDWNLDGRFALEFIVWFFHDFVPKSDYICAVHLLPVSPAPFVNTPGECLSFVIEGGKDADPATLGKKLREFKDEVFLSPRDAAALSDESPALGPNSYPGDESRD